ncbi:preprotein translocase subunit SecE [Streptomyces sp. TRM 70351]|uniref:preprotein translocase subunit SecE n=1 Tax=Streptomyces sp. TRM 70351 TaxID=3116552 RepID=UPI002E7B84B5|nr:preprotein translocase subunit SecE [Streptomyces sp. TRM 70351]MEE1930925.1 preprotein translocase subunit SecE [Streptomyces sp. TRM 70351]
MAEITDTAEVPEPGRPDDGKPRRGGKRGKKGPLGRLALFYRQIVAELRKVVWPKRHQLATYTTVVIFFVLIVIGFVFVIDYGFNEVVSFVFG